MTYWSDLVDNLPPHLAVAIGMGKLIAQVRDELLRSIERGDVTIEEETGSEALLSIEVWRTTVGNAGFACASTSREPENTLRVRGVDPEDYVGEKFCSRAVKACFRLVKRDALNVPTGQSLQKLNFCVNVSAPDNDIDI
jgi:hypothetical protein